MLRKTSPSKIPEDLSMQTKSALEAGSAACYRIVSPFILGISNAISGKMDIF